MNAVQIIRILSANILAIIVGFYLTQLPAYGGDKVAVVVNLGENFGQLANALRERERLAKEAYRALGYRVIVLSLEKDENGIQNPPTQTELTRQIGNLRHVSELKIDILGHGKIIDIDQLPNSSDIKDRFPATKILAPNRPSGTSYEYDTINKKEVGFVAVSAAFNPNCNLSYDRPECFQNHIGTGDLRKMITTAQANNPELSVTIHAMNCYSGCIGQALSDMKGVQVFASSVAGEVANIDSDTKNPGPKGLDPDGLHDYMSNYYDVLLASAKNRQSLSEQQIHDKIMEIDQKRNKEFPFFSYTHRPRSSLQLYLEQWCMDHPQTHQTTTCRECSSSNAVPGLSSLIKTVSETALSKAELAYNMVLNDIGMRLTNQGCEHSFRSEIAKMLETNHSKFNKEIKTWAIASFRTKISDFEKMIQNNEPSQQVLIASMREQRCNSIKKRLDLAKNGYLSQERLQNIKNLNAAFKKCHTMKPTEIIEEIKKEIDFLETQWASSDYQNTDVLGELVLEIAAPLFNQAYEPLSCRRVVSVSDYTPKPNETKIQALQRMTSVQNQYFECMRTAFSRNIGAINFLHEKPDFDWECNTNKGARNLYRNYLGCVQQFRNKAPKEDWERLLELTQAGGRTTR